MAEATSITPQIPDYELIRMIGKGSYGDVWLAKGLTGIYSAIKVVWKDRFEDTSPYEREYSGLQKFAAISRSQPNQLAILHVGKNDEERFFYYVMELADDVNDSQKEDIDPATYKANSLREQIRRKKSLSVEDCVEYGVGVSRALATLHQNDLVHRDIKPSNILIVNGIPKLGDIGLVSPPKDDLTFVGTEGYIPPEGPGQIQGDIFGLGKVLYELATGLSRREFPKLPSSSSGPKGERKQLLELNEVLLRACDPNLNRRYRTADELKDGLLLVRAGKSVRRLYLAERGVRRTMRYAMALGVIAAIGVVGALLERERANASERLVEYAAGLTQAKAAVDRNDFGSARAQLAKLTPRMVGEKEPAIEWRALNARALGDQSEILRTEGPRPSVIRFTPDQKAYAIQYLDRTLTLYDAETDAVLETITGVRRLIGITPDGKYYIGLDDVHRFKRWPVLGNGQGIEYADSPDRLFRLGMDDQGRAYAIDYKRNCQVIEAHPDGSLFRHNVISQQMLDAKWMFYLGEVGPKGDIVFKWGNLANSEVQYRLSYWDRKSGSHFSDVPERPRRIGIDLQGVWAVLDFSGDELRLNDHLLFEKTGKRFSDSLNYRFRNKDFEIQTAKSEIIVEYQPSNSEERSLFTLRGHASEINSVEFSPPSTLISGAHDGEIRRWDLSLKEKYKPRFQHSAHDGRSFGLQFLDDNRLAVPGAKGTSVVLSMPHLQVIETIEGMKSPSYLDGNKLVGTGQGGLILFDESTSSVTRKLLDQPIKSIFRLDEQKISLLVMHSGELLAAHDNGVIESWGEGWEQCRTLCVDSSMQKIWTRFEGPELICWDVATRSVSKKIKLDNYTVDLNSHEPSNRLFLITADGIVEIRSFETGNLIDEFQSGSSTPQFIRYFQSENRILIGDANGMIQVFKGDTYHYLSSIELPQEVVLRNIELSPDGSSLIAMGSKGLIQTVSLN